MPMIVSAHSTLSVLFLVAQLSLAHPPPFPLCKATTGSPDWPSPWSWARLNESIGGRLLQPTPPGAVCHPGQPTYNASACPAVTSGWATYDFHQNDAVSSMWNQFNNDSCLPDPSDPCSGEGYPVFVINATTAGHVKCGVDFGKFCHLTLHGSAGD
jgi:hypothetical protein